MKKIAFILYDRQAEALRVATGLTLLNDKVDIFLLDNKLQLEDAASSLIVKNIEMLDMLGTVSYFYNFKEKNPFYKKFTFLNNTQFAKKLLDYNYIIKY
jgi:hypothetical protein